MTIIFGMKSRVGILGEALGVFEVLLPAPLAAKLAQAQLHIRRARRACCAQGGMVAREQWASPRVLRGSIAHPARARS